MEYILLYKKHLSFAGARSQMNTTLYQNRPQLNKFAFGTRPGGGGAGLLLYNGLMGMCRWMGSHFHDWIDNNGVPFSIVTRMGSHIFGFFAGYLA